MKLPKQFGPPPDNMMVFPHFYCPTCVGMRFLRLDAVMENESYGRKLEVCYFIVSCPSCREIIDVVPDRDALLKKYDKFSAS